VGGHERKAARYAQQQGRGLRTRNDGSYGLTARTIIGSLGAFLGAF
jgi:hypothetical protein